MLAQLRWPRVCAFEPTHQTPSHHTQTHKPSESACRPPQSGGRTHTTHSAHEPQTLKIGGTASHLPGLWCQVRATTHRESILGPVVPVLKISCAHCIGMICDENCLRACVHFSVRIDFFCMHGRECFSYARTYFCVRALCASMCHDASRCQDCTGTTALVRNTHLFPSCSICLLGRTHARARAHTHTHTHTQVKDTALSCSVS